MSFAFEADAEDVKHISNAISEVLTRRDDEVIFLAAAGNFSRNQTDMFPARHRDVISIHAGTSHRTFFESDPVPIGPDREFGTFGGDLPKYVGALFPALSCAWSTSSN
jgi:hypothetical protein